jgi:hypothetical protein
MEWNVGYWYSRAGYRFRRLDLKEEWEVFLEGLM